MLDSFVIDQVNRRDRRERDERERPAVELPLPAPDERARCAAATRTAATRSRSAASWSSTSARFTRRSVSPSLPALPEGAYKAPAMTEIIDIGAREILDSRGNPTVEVEVTLDGR